MPAAWQVRLNVTLSAVTRSPVDLICRGNQVKTVDYRTLRPVQFGRAISSPCKPGTLSSTTTSRSMKHRASVPIREPSASPVTNQVGRRPMQAAQSFSRNFFPKPGENSVGFAAALSSEIRSRSLRSNLPIE